MSQTKGQTKAIVGVGFVFFFGIVSGVALTMKFVESRIHDLVDGGPQKLGEIVVRRLDHQLILDPEQRRQVEQIALTARDSIQTLRAQAQPQVDRIMDTSITQIRAVLKPEQAKKFDEIVKASRAPKQPSAQ